MKLFFLKINQNLKKKKNQKTYFKTIKDFFYIYKIKQ